MRLGIYGAGGNGRGLMDVVRKGQLQRGKEYEEVFFIDDVIGKDTFYDAKVYSYEQVKSLYGPDELEIAISLGDPTHREMLFEKIKGDQYHLATVIEKNADISPSVCLGEGVLIANATISSDAVIEDNVLISAHAIIGHDTIVRKHCVVSAAAFVAGHCQVMEKVYVGPCSSVRDRILIGESSVIAMGAAVYKDVPANATAMGNPARNTTLTGNRNLFQ